MTQTDPSELSAIARGDEAAFQRLVRQCSPLLARLAARLVGPDSDDVMQESWTKAYMALRSGRFDAKREGASIDVWLRQIVARTAYDWLRSRRRRKARDVRLQGHVAENASARVALRQLDVLLESLPPAQRVALLLKEVEGMTTREISLVLKCSEGAVEQRLVRARATLRDHRSTHV